MTPNASRDRADTWANALDFDKLGAKEGIIHRWLEWRRRLDHDHYSQTPAHAPSSRSVSQTAVPSSLHQSQFMTPDSLGQTTRLPTPTSTSPPARNSSLLKEEPPSPLSRSSLPLPPTTSKSQLSLDIVQKPDLLQKSEINPPLLTATSLFPSSSSLQNGPNRLYENGIPPAGGAVVDPGYITLPSLREYLRASFPNRAAFDAMVRKELDQAAGKPWEQAKLIGQSASELHDTLLQMQGANF